MNFSRCCEKIPGFVLKITRTFFKNELAALKIENQKQTPQKFKGVRLNIVATVNSIGEGMFCI